MNEEHWRTLYRDGIVAFWVHDEAELIQALFDVVLRHISFRISVSRKDGTALIIVLVGR